MNFWDRVEAINRAKKRLIPDDGFNLVGVDGMESEAGQELYLISHHTDRDDAERAKGEYESKHPSETLYIYDKDS